VHSINEIAGTILDGFDRHYLLFQKISAAARARFEQADWRAVSEANRERIDLYGLRVTETVESVLGRHPEAANDESLWPQIKTAYIGLLHEHLQPECAETFYNSVACRVLNRRHYHNRYIFWRPAISLEHLHGEHPTYRGYYPRARGLRRCLLEILRDYGLAGKLANLRRDVNNLCLAFADTRENGWQAYPNYQLQTLYSLFYRNKAAYIVGREINGPVQRFFVIPILLDDQQRPNVDALLTDPGDIAILFSFSRAYFMVDMQVPSAYVDFLRSGLPSKPLHELYSMLGLQKQGKTMFYRELQHHLRHSSDNFETAPGIKGMVMLVFTLASLPFVFKIIRDRFEPPKESTRQEVKDKYQLVKMHDRVGRLAGYGNTSDCPPARICWRTANQ
jgi:isocitrate dehydrogenase kinase/phosphatase